MFHVCCILDFDYQQIEVGTTNSAFKREKIKDNYEIHDVMSTQKVRTFMESTRHRSRYREFEGKTFFEFVQEENLSKHDLTEILLYKVSGSVCRK